MDPKLNIDDFLLQQAANAPQAEQAPMTLEEELMMRLSAMNKGAEPKGYPMKQLPAPTEKELAMQKKLAPDMNAGFQPRMGMAVTPEPVSEKQLAADSFGINKEFLKRAILRQMQGTDQMETDLRRYKDMAPDINWKPLAAVLDQSVRGGKLAESLPDAETPEQRAQKIAGIENLIEQRRNDSTGQISSVLQAELSNRLANSKMQQDRFKDRQNLTMFNTAAKEQGKLLKDISEFKTNTTNVEDAITPDAQGTVSVGRVESSLSSFAKLMGEKGVLTDTDIARQLRPTIDIMLARYRAILGSDPNARMDVSQVASIKEALETAKRGFDQVSGAKTDAFEKTYFNPTSPYGAAPWAPEMINQVREMKKNLLTPKTQTAAPTGLPSQDAIAAEMARRSKQ